MPLPDSELLGHCISRLFAQFPLSDVKLLDRTQQMSFVVGKLVLCLKKRLRYTENTTELFRFRVGHDSYRPCGLRRLPSSVLEPRGVVAEIEMQAGRRRIVWRYLYFPES